MDKCQSAGKVVVCQVGKILTQLEARQHTLIYNVLARQRADVEVFVLNTTLNALADKIQRALEIRHTVVCNAGNKQLLYVRLASQCRLAEAVGICRNVAQVHKRQPLALYLLNHYAQYVLLLSLILRQEDESRSVFSLFRNRYSLQENKLMRYLQHYSGSVACLVVGTLGTAVSHVLEHFQGVVNKFMALVSMYVDNHAHAACVMLVFRIIQSFSHN